MGRNELQKQKAIWRVFGVDYEKEKEKQKLIWENMKAKQPSRVESPPGYIFKRKLMLKRFQKVLVPAEFEREYRDFKNAVYRHLRHRPDFAKRIDRRLIERLARIWTLWLLYEKRLSIGPPEELARLTDGFYKIDAMLSRALEELHLTPSLRRKITADLQEDDEITKKLKELLKVK